MNTNADFESHVGEMIDIIAANFVTEIISPTGSGKSSILPPALAAQVRVMVSTPTRTSARNLYNRVKDTHPSLTVGYAAEGDVKYKSDTRLVYATSGHVRRKMFNYFKNGSLTAGGLNFCDILLLDEIHSGSVDNSIIVSLWMEAFRQSQSSGDPNLVVPRLILMTATPVPININPPAQRYEVPDTKTPYAVEEQYMKDYHKDEERWSALASKAAELHTKTDPSTGHILVFLPGSASVDHIVNELYDMNLKNALIIGLYGQSSKEDVDLVYKDATPGIRKIVVATNIAETSVTLYGLGYVLDSMLEKRPGTSSTGGPKLTITFISKKSAQQRKGRTGRTNPGLCIRFISQESYDKLEDNRDFDINSVPIHNEIVEIINTGLNPLAILFDVNQERVIDTMKELVKMNMLQQDKSSDGVIVSELGRFASQTPLSIRQTAFLWNWIEERGTPFIGIVIACIIDSDPQNIFKWPRRNQGESNKDFNDRIEDHEERYYTKFIHSPMDDIPDNHLEVCLKVWSDLVINVRGDIFAYKSWNKIGDWCRNNGMGFKKITELITMIKHTMSSVSRSQGIKIDKGIFNPTTVSSNASLILIKINADLAVYKVKEKRVRYKHKATGEYYILARRSIPGDLSEYDSLITLNSVMTDNQSGFRQGLISMAIPNQVNVKRESLSFDIVPEVEILDDEIEPSSPRIPHTELSFSTSLTSPKPELVRINELINSKLPSLLDLNPDMLDIQLGKMDELGLIPDLESHEKTPMMRSIPISSLEFSLLPVPGSGSGSGSVTSSRGRGRGDVKGRGRGDLKSRGRGDEKRGQFTPPSPERVEDRSRGRGRGRETRETRVPESKVLYDPPILATIGSITSGIKISIKRYKAPLGLTLGFTPSMLSPAPSIYDTQVNTMQLGTTYLGNPVDVMVQPTPSTGFSIYS